MSKEVKASIDIGSNSILLLIAEVNGESLKVLHEDATITGLGRGLDQSKSFSPTAMQESLTCLKIYVETLQKYNIDPTQVTVTATEASRVSLNATEFFVKVAEETGLQVKIITGEGEAHFSAMGTMLGLAKKQPIEVIMDIGGASTELVKVQTAPFNIVETVSLPMGVVRFKNWQEQGILKEKINEILDDYAPKISQFKTKNLISIAGTMTGIACIEQGLAEFDETKINGYQISRQKLNETYEQIIKWGPLKLLELFPYQGKRTETLGYGAQLASIMGEKLDVDFFSISTYGLRYGSILGGEKINEFQFKADK